MPAPLPPLAAVRAFEAAARLLNFTEAAAELGMTQAAVSYQVKLLEQRLGMTLFLRIGRRIELSAQGQALAPVVIRAFDEMRAGFANLSTDNGAVLTVTCTNSFANLWLAPRVGQFQMSQPDLAVRILPADNVLDFARENVDIAIRGGLGDWPGFACDLLAHNRLVPLASPDYLAREGPFASAEDLLKAQRISPENQWWTLWFSEMGLSPPRTPARPALAMDSQFLEGRAALAGQGVCIVIAAFWKAEIESGALVEPVPSHILEDRSYWLVYQPASRNLPKIKAFRDWINGEFARDRKDDRDGFYLPPI